MAVRKKPRPTEEKVETRLIGRSFMDIINADQATLDAWDKKNAETMRRVKRRLRARS